MLTPSPIRPADELDRCEPSDSPRRRPRRSSPPSSWPRARATPSSRSLTCSSSWSSSPMAWCPPSWTASAMQPGSVAEAIRGELAKLPKVSGARPAHAVERGAPSPVRRAPVAERMRDEYVSTEHLLLTSLEAGRRPARRLLTAGRRRPEAVLEALTADPREPARDVREPRGDLRGAREVRPRPDRCRPQGQARPGHRPRRGDPARHPGPQPADEEQPGAHRRARAWARRPSRRASPSGSCAATCPRG